MQITKIRRIIKSFADDTRLRIINLLSNAELTVGELCLLLNKNQSNLSKHLTRLRLTDIVTDKREGSNVYYYLKKSKEVPYKGLFKVVTEDLSDLQVFKSDLRNLKKLNRRFRQNINKKRRTE